MGETMNFLIHIITYPSAWIIHLFQNAGVWEIFVITIVFVLLFRYIIYPLVGGASPTGVSDMVNGAQKINNDAQKESRNYIQKMRTRKVRARKK